MRYKRIYLNPVGDTVRVYFLGDVHEGAINSRTDLLQEAINVIASDADSYWIGMGDMIDAINYHDKRFNVREVSEHYRVQDLDDLPKRQADRLLAMLYPIKDRCLGMLTGNHEDTVRQRMGLDIVSYMCGVLGATFLGKKAYVSIGAVTDTNRGRPYYMINMCIAHGSGGGGGKTAGGAINKVVDMMQWDTADVYVIGHLHSMMLKSAVRNAIRGNGLVKEKVYYGVNGSFLMKSSMESDSYFEDAAGMETVPGMLVCSFNARTPYKDKCKLNLEAVEMM